MITFGLNAVKESMHPYAEKVLTDILNAVGIKSCTISSTARTPFDQARIMYDNITRYGVAHQRRLYAAAGDLVIDAYENAKAAGKQATDIRTIMAQRIIEVGPSKVSHHCSDPRILCVFDVAPTSISNKASFEKSVRTDTRVSKFITPPADPGYHLEIPIPRK